MNFPFRFQFSKSDKELSCIGSNKLKMILIEIIQTIDII